MSESEQPATPGVTPAPSADSALDTRPAVERITAAAAAIEAMADLPLAEHAEQYQQLHTTLQAELGAIAHL